MLREEEDCNKVGRQGEARRPTQPLEVGKFIQPGDDLDPVIVQLKFGQVGEANQITDGVQVLKREHQMLNVLHLRLGPNFLSLFWLSIFQIRILPHEDASLNQGLVDDSKLGPLHASR